MQISNYNQQQTVVEGSCGYISRKQNPYKKENFKFSLWEQGYEQQKLRSEGWQFTSEGCNAFYFNQRLDSTIDLPRYTGEPEDNPCDSSKWIKFKPPISGQCLQNPYEVGTNKYCLWYKGYQDAEIFHERTNKIGYEKLSVAEINNQGKLKGYNAGCFGKTTLMLEIETGRLFVNGILTGKKYWTVENRVYLDDSEKIIFFNSKFEDYKVGDLVTDIFYYSKDKSFKIEISRDEDMRFAQGFGGELKNIYKYI